jgi:hypothetical protein
VNGGGKGRMELPELNSAMFNRETHVNEYGSLLGMVDGKSLDNALRERAVGWCSGERLCFRPIDDTVVGLMCEDKDFNRFWFHLARRKFDEVFRKETET